MRFFVGVHHPKDGWPLSLRGRPVCISANALRSRAGRIAFGGQGRRLDARFRRLQPGGAERRLRRERQGDPRAIGVILERILRARPDLRLHGFGVKLTALRSAAVRSMLHSADSMAWSYAARRQGGDQNGGWRPSASPSASPAACAWPATANLGSSDAGRGRWESREHGRSSVERSGWRSAPPRRFRLDLAPRSAGFKGGPAGRRRRSACRGPLRPAARGARAVQRRGEEAALPEQLRRP